MGGGASCDAGAPRDEVIVDGDAGILERAGASLERPAPARELRRLIDGGGLCAVVAPSGSGKSTFVASAVAALRAEGAFDVVRCVFVGAAAGRRRCRALGALCAALRRDLDARGLAPPAATIPDDALGLGGWFAAALEALAGDGAKVLVVLGALNELDGEAARASAGSPPAGRRRSWRRASRAAPTAGTRASSRRCGRSGAPTSPPDARAAALDAGEQAALLALGGSMAALRKLEGKADRSSPLYLRLVGYLVDVVGEKPAKARSRARGAAREAAPVVRFVHQQARDAVERRWLGKKGAKRDAPLFRYFAATTAATRARRSSRLPAHAVGAGDAAAAKRYLCAVAYGERNAAYDVPEGFVCDARWAPDGERFAPRWRASVVFAGDGSSNARLATVDGGAAAVCFSADGASLLAARGRRSRRVRSALAAPSAFAAAHDEKINAVDAVEACVATAGDDGRVALYDATTGTVARVVAAHGDVAKVVRLFRFQDELWALSGSEDRTARLICAKTGASHALRGHSAAVSAVAPFGGFCATAGDDGTCRVWDLRLVQTQDAIPGSDRAISGVVCRPDGRSSSPTSAASSALDATGEAVLWTAPKLESGGHDAITSLALDADGARRLRRLPAAPCSTRPPARPWPRCRSATG
ncbi:hypothetical protein JL720_7850 [Aureococcus anophagefferens]|nr:hypothetical protein JL720_7850 [Aureococcus anophagefferens]